MTATAPDSWTFRRLRRADFPLLKQWLEEPLIHRWWHHETTPEAMERDFGAGVEGEEPGEDLIAECNGLPAGLIQRSRFQDYPDYAEALAALVPIAPQAWTLDYLLSEDYRGGGRGAQMLTAAIEDLRQSHPEATELIVPVAAGNVRSWRTLRALGFTRVAEGDLEPDNPIDPPLHYIHRLVLSPPPATVVQGDSDTNRLSASEPS